MKFKRIIFFLLFFCKLSNAFSSTNSKQQIFQKSYDELIKKINSFKLKGDSVSKLLKFSNQFILMIILYGAKSLKIEIKTANTIKDEFLSSICPKNSEILKIKDPNTKKTFKEELQTFYDKIKDSTDIDFIKDEYQKTKSIFNKIQQLESKISKIEDCCKLLNPDNSLRGSEQFKADFFITIKTKKPDGSEQKEIIINQNSSELKQITEMKSRFISVNEKFLSKQDLTVDDLNSAYDNAKLLLEKYSSPCKSDDSKIDYPKEFQEIIDISSQYINFKENFSSELQGSQISAFTKLITPLEDLISDIQKETQLSFFEATKIKCLTLIPPLLKKYTNFLLQKYDYLFDKFEDSKEEFRSLNIIFDYSDFDFEFIIKSLETISKTLESLKRYQSIYDFLSSIFSKTKTEWQTKDSIRNILIEHLKKDFQTKNIKIKLYERFTPFLKDFCIMEKEQKLSNDSDELIRYISEIKSKIDTEKKEINSENNKVVYKMGNVIKKNCLYSPIDDLLQKINTSLIISFNLVYSCTTTICNLNNLFQKVKAILMFYSIIKHTTKNTLPFNIDITKWTSIQKLQNIYENKISLESIDPDVSIDKINNFFDLIKEYTQPIEPIKLIYEYDILLTRDELIKFSESFSKKQSTTMLDSTFQSKKDEKITIDQELYIQYLKLLDLSFDLKMDDSGTKEVMNKAIKKITILIHPDKQNQIPDNTMEKLFDKLIVFYTYNLSKLPLESTDLTIQQNKIDEIKKEKIRYTSMNAEQKQKAKNEITVPLRFELDIIKKTLDR